MANPSATGPFSFDGVWLMPLTASGGLESDKYAFIGAGSPSVSHARQEESFSVVGRNEPIVQASGVIELATGVIEGTLITRHGVDYMTWKDRLENLVRNQENYWRIWLASPHRFYTNVSLGGWEDSFVVRGDGSWDVSLPFRERRD